MRFFRFALAGIVLAVPLLAFAGDFYQWVDKKGATHFADSLAGVPPQYRKQVEEREYKKRPPKSTVKDSSVADGYYGSHAAPERKSGRKGKLKRFAIRYKAYEGAARRIIIPVTFNGSVTAMMALDTGAPGLVISPKLAERIGVYKNNEGKLQTIAGGIGGRISAIYTIIDSIEIGGAKDKFIPATVTGSISGAFEGLVGMDFMSNFSIKIDTANHLLIFEETPPRPNMPGGHTRSWWKINFYNFGGMRAYWKRVYGNLKKLSGAGTGSRSIAEREFAKKQYEEAEKLYRKLDRYANYNSVPMHWRKR